ncbi:MAG: class I SAM-dependent methyltransferase [Candidatus Bathyarchaeota archaeon]|nr:class I SAM-dependent methyltransferase [Candidatus Bathyarchaeota archaeon]
MDVERQNKERTFWDKFARKYDPFMVHRAATYELMIKRIEGFIDSSTDVLEAATGTIALAIAHKSRKVYACDISQEMINVAKEKLAASLISNVEFRVQDAYNLDYTSASVDVVIVSNVLHIMLHPEKALASIHRVLKKDGFLLVGVFCHGNSVKTRIISFFMSLIGFRAYHKWSPQSFNSFLESNNYEIIQNEIFKDKIPLAFVVAKKTGAN